MSYDNAISKMYALGHELSQTPSYKFDLAHMRVLLAALNHPERRFPGVLIGGTNGKGSTAATLASILEVSGLKTGLYTSPHLIRINERIRINSTEINDEDFAQYHEAVDRIAGKLVSSGELPWRPSFFEMLTAIAFEYFAKNKVDIAVLEVGMGGRLDATNVIEPLLSVITDISLDHQKFLGETVAEIAREKAGIIRRGGVAVTLPQHPEANDVIGNTILDLGATAVNAVPYMPPVSPGSAPHFGVAPQNVRSSHDRATLIRPMSRYPLEVRGKRIIVETPLLGRHQFRNIALAIASAVELANNPLLAQTAREKWGAHPQITPHSIERGIRQTKWPGRFQILPAHNGAPEFIFDVAHNPAGAWALRSTLSSCYENRRLIFVFGAMRDKAIAEIAEILFPIAKAVVVTKADNPRSATVEEIRQASARVATKMEACPDIPSALDQAQILAGPEGLVVVTGSIYIVGEAMHALGVNPSMSDGPQRRGQ
jgi:dihydrofolate synthase/folylpolyglutamate synthase